MKDRTRKIIVAVLLVIAVCCAGYLIWCYATAAKTKQSYDDAKKLVTENVKPSKTDSDDGEQTKPEIPVDFTALQEKNPDIYAWIKIDGTTVDYPVCQNNEDDNYYLSHTWERVEAADGAIFTQACNSKNFTDFNTVIYGHQMGEGVDTMFHTLDRYLEEGYIEKYELIEDGVFKTIHITLKYGADKNEKVITGLKRISKPGLRVYAGSEDLPKVLGGLGTAVISTNKGVITDKEARKLGVGGEVLCYIW